MNDNPKYWVMARYSAKTVLEHNPDLNVVFVCDGEIPEEEKRKARVVCAGRCEFLDVGPAKRSRGFEFRNPWFGNINSLRLLIPEVDGMEKYERVLSLDADTECHGSIAGFFDEDSEGHDLIGCPDVGFPPDGSQRDMSLHVREQKLSGEEMAELDRVVGEEWREPRRNDPYVNGGSVMFCLGEIRRRMARYGERIVLAKRLLESHTWTFFEQDILNLVMDIKRLTVDDYDWMPFTGRADEGKPMWHITGGMPKERRALEDRGYAYDREAFPGELKVTVYAITKNEEKFVDRWVDSMREADEIVVLDTGSTDRTREMLEARGCTVAVKEYSPWKTMGEYDRLVAEGKTPWRFDVARNDSMDLVPKDTDVCVCTDLDEVLLPGWRSKLERAWMEKIRFEGKRPTTAKYEYVWNFNPDGSDGTVFTYEKVHTLGSCRWAHPVHEILDYPGEKVEVYVPGMRLEHHADPAKSRGQYLNLLEMSVREAPEDDRNMHYLGREYMFRGMWDRCIETLTRHLEMPTARWNAERANSMRFIARAYREKGEPVKSVEWLRTAVMTDPGQREAAVDLAQLGYEMTIERPGEAPLWWAVCVEGAEKAVAVKTRSVSYITKSECWGPKPWDLLCLGCWYTGRRDEARVAAAEAVRRDGFRNRRLMDNARSIGVTVVDGRRL